MLARCRRLFPMREAEYAALFAAAGLRLRAVVPLGDPLGFGVFGGGPA